MPTLLKTSISATSDIYDLNGQWLPRGNYYFSIQRMSNTHVTGTLSDRTFAAEYIFKPEVVIKMMAVAQARLARRANITHENMPNLASPTESNRYPTNLGLPSISTTETQSPPRAHTSPTAEAARRRQSNNDRTMCMICLEFIEDGGEALGCMHRFHRPCIRRWLRNRRQPSCPVCRTRVTGQDHSNNSNLLPANRNRQRQRRALPVIRNIRQPTSNHRRIQRRREYNRLYAQSRVNIIG